MFRHPIFLNTLWAAGLVAIGGCEGSELAGSERSGLSRGVGVYDADILPRSAAGKDLDAGLWLFVHNDLPVIRQDGQIVSQAFLEAEVSAWDEHEPATPERNHRRGRNARNRENEGTFETRQASSLRYALRGRILSESMTSFWISPEQLDALVAKSGGRLGFSVKDSVQYASSPYPCWIEGRDPVEHVKPSSEQRVQQRTLRVEGRYPLTYKCTLE